MSKNKYWRVTEEKYGYPVSEITEKAANMFTTQKDMEMD